MEPQNTEPQPLEERLQSQARSVDLRQAVMAALTGKESRRWTISELVERLKNLGVSRLTRAGVTGALAELELELPDDQLRDLPQRLIGFDRCYEGALPRSTDARRRRRAWKVEHKTSRAGAAHRAASARSLPSGHISRRRWDRENCDRRSCRRPTGARNVEEARLFKLSTRVRGSGTVGQMSTLINQAFQIVIEQAGKARYSFLIIDEADSLAGARGVGQSHHEDKVAVNTLIQKVDDVRRFAGRVLIFLCTNRFGALDPAIVRRAGRVEPICWRQRRPFSLSPAVGG